MSALQSCKKLLRKRAKMCDKRKKLRNTAEATHFQAKIIAINFSNTLSLICRKIPSTGAESKTLICYI